MELQRGMRDKLDKYIALNEVVHTEINITGNSSYDFCCFGVDSDDKLSDERYMIFYNQTESPSGEIRYKGADSSACFDLDLEKLPQNIKKLVFTVSIDGNSTMKDIESLTLSISQNGNRALTLSLSGKDFGMEKAVIAAEIYFKDIWRINAVARGYNGGLGDLLREYGGTEADVPAVEPSQPEEKISLEKKLEKAPKLISLAKPIKIELKKKNLQNTSARVALVMDISGSMSVRYRNGTVQEVINHILPLAVQFDDDGELDLWYYGNTCRKMDPVSISNYEYAVPEDWKKLMSSVGGTNNEPVVIEEVLSYFKSSTLPVYVIFITDGGVSRAGQIKKLISQASEYPIFWQFVGIGGKNYGILEKLDNLEGRYVDNADFFALDDFMKISNEELYSRLLNEFPVWLSTIRQKNMI